MIKDRNVSDDAMIAGHKINGLGQVGNKVLYVGTDGTQAYELAATRLPGDQIYTGLDAAVNAATASRGEQIVILPNHAETVASASAITVDVAGLDILCLGSGAARPTFTFSDTAATMVISAANVSMKGFIVKPSVDSVVSPIVVSGADCTLDYEHQDASAAVEAVRSLLTTATADRLKVNLKYLGFIAGNACVNAIRLVGCDTARIYVDFYGVASTSVVEFHTTACHDIIVDGKFYNNGTTLTKNVVDTQGSSTWSATGWDGNSNATFSGGDNAALAADDVAAVSTALATAQADLDILTGASGANLLTATQASIDAIETDTGTTLPATLAALPQCVVKTDGAVLTGNDDLFVISGGPVRCKITGIVTTIIGGASNGDLMITTTSPAATTTLNAAPVAIDNDAAGTLYYNVGATSVFTPVTAGFIILDPVTVEETEFILPPGTVLFRGSAAQTGVIAWYMEYTPLSPLSVVTAAA